MLNSRLFSILGGALLIVLAFGLIANLAIFFLSGIWHYGSPIITPVFDLWGAHVDLNAFSTGASLALILAGILAVSGRRWGSVFGALLSGVFTAWAFSDPGIWNTAGGKVFPVGIWAAFLTAAVFLAVAIVLYRPKAAG